MATITVSIQQGNNTLNSHHLATENTEVLRIQAQKNVNYLLTDESTGFAPENLTATRHGKDLHIAFEGSQEADLIIENYYEDGNNNLLIGLHENGQYYAYIPESANSLDIVTQLAEQVSAGQALGGEALNAAVFNSAFNPAWLFLPLAIGGIAAAAGGGSSNNNNNSVIARPVIKPSINDAERKFDGGASVTPSANAGTLNIRYPDHNGKTVSIKATKSDHDNDPSTPAIWTATDQNGKTLPNVQDPNNPNSPWIDPTNGKVTLPPNSVPNGETVSAEQSIDGKNSSPATAQIIDQIPPNAPKSDINQENGEVSIDPNTDPSTTKTTTTYINDQGKETTVHTAKGDHDNDPSTPDIWTGTVVDEKGKEIPNSGVEIDSSTGIITIAGENIKEGSKIEAKASDDGNNISPPATDYKPPAPQPRITANIDGSATVSELKNVKDSTLEISGTYAQPQAGMNKFRFTLNWDGIKWAKNTSLDPIEVGTGKDGKPIVTVNAGVAKDGSKITAIQKVPGLGQGKHEVTMRDQIPEPQVIDNSDGSVSITPTPSKIAEPTEVTISYTDENGKEKTVIVSKDPNNSNEWTSSNPNIAADPKTGAVTLPESSVQDGSTVSAKQKVTLTDPNTQKQTDAVSSDETVIAGNAIPNPEIIANGDGSVSIKPSDTATQTTVNYTDENGKKQEKTFTKEDTNGDGRPDTWKDNDPNDKVSINPMTGEITIPADEVKDGSTATATQTLPNDTQGTGHTIAKAQNGDSSTTVKPDIKAGPDGSAIVTLHPDAEKSTITYTDEKGKGKIVTVSKDPKTNEWTNSDPAVSIDASGEKPVITVAGTDIKDGSTVTATQSTAAGASAPASVKVADNTPEPTIKAEENGSVSVTPSKKATEVNIRYTDESGAEKTVTVSKDLKTNEWTSSDPAVSVDKDTGTVSIPADKVKDGSEVTANQTVDGQKSNDATDRAKENDTTDKPSIAEETRDKDNDAPISVTPGKDNTKVTIDYTDEDGKNQTIVVEKDKDGNWKPSKDSTVEVKDTPTADNKTPYVESTGKVTLPKDAVDNDKPVTVTGEKDGSAPAKEQTDPTDKPIIAEETRDKDNDAPISVTPGKDNTKATIDYTDEDGKNQTIVVEKDKDGKWKPSKDSTVEVKDTPTADNKTPYVESTGKVTLPKDAVDNDKPVTVTGEKDGSAPAKEQTDPTDKPDIAEEKRDADNDAPISVTPGEDNTKVTINYTDEDGKDQTIVMEKDKDGNWKPTGESSVPVDNKPSTDNKTPYVDPTTGKVTLPKDAVDNDKPVTVTGEKDGSAPAKEQTNPTDKPSIAEVPRGTDNDAPINVTPGDDNTKATIDYTDEDGKDQTIVIEKDQDGNWKPTSESSVPVDNKPSTDDKTPYVDPTTGKVTLPKDAVDNDKPVTVTGEKDGSAPAKEQTNPTDKPSIAEVPRGTDNDAPINVTPGDDNTKATIDYTDEDGKDQTIVIEKDQGGNWTPSKDSTVEVKDTPTADNKTPYVDPTTGKVTLPKDAVDNDKPVTVTGEKDGSAPAKEQTNPADKPDIAAKDDGSVEVTPKGNNTKVLVGYKDEDGKDQTIVVEKDKDGNWKPSKDSTVEVKDTPMADNKTPYVDSTGKVTLPKDAVKDESTVTVKATGENDKGKPAINQADSKKDSAGTDVDPDNTGFTNPTGGNIAEGDVVRAKIGLTNNNGGEIDFNITFSQDNSDPNVAVANHADFDYDNIKFKDDSGKDILGIRYDQNTGKITVPAGVDKFNVELPVKAGDGVEVDQKATVVIGKDKTAEITIIDDSKAAGQDNGIEITAISDDTGLAGDFVTNDTTLTVSGTLNKALPADEKIQVTLNEKTVDAVVDASGKRWTADFTGIELPEGTYLAKAQIVSTNDPKTKTDGPSDDQTIVIDTTPPTANAPSVSIASGDDKIINAKEKADGKGKVDVKVTIPANAEVGDVIVVTDKDNKELGKFIVDTGDNAAGKTKTVQADIPADGENASVEVTATVYDKAGNKGEEGKDTASVDTNAPDMPKVEAKDNGVVEVTPAADATEITVKYTDEQGKPQGKTFTKEDTNGDGKPDTWKDKDSNDKVSIDSTGKVTIAADEVKDKTEVTATNKDKAGNESEKGEAEAKAPKGTTVPGDVDGNGTADDDDNSTDNVNLPNGDKTPSTVNGAPVIVFVDDADKNGTLSDAEIGTDKKVQAAITIPDKTQAGDKIAVSINGGAVKEVTLTDEDIQNGHIVVDVPTVDEKGEKLAEVSVKAKAVTADGKHESGEGEKTATLMGKLTVSIEAEDDLTDEDSSKLPTNYEKDKFIGKVNNSKGSNYENLTTGLTNDSNIKFTVTLQREMTDKEKVTIVRQTVARDKDGNIISVGKEEEIKSLTNKDKFVFDATDNKFKFNFEDSTLKGIETYGTEYRYTAKVKDGNTHIPDSSKVLNLKLDTIVEAFNMISASYNRRTGYKFEGKTEKGSKIHLTYEDTSGMIKTLDATVGDEGQFNFTIPNDWKRNSKNAVLTITDAAGNVSQTNLSFIPRLYVDMNTEKALNFATQDNVIGSQRTSTDKNQAHIMSDDDDWVFIGGTIGTQWAAPNIDMSGGDDYLFVGSNITSGPKFDMGSGNDKLEFEGGFAGGFYSIKLGNGNDILDIATNIDNSVTADIDAGAGNDIFRIGGNWDGKGTVDFGAGDDIATIGGYIAGAKTINFGEGNDVLIVNGKAPAIITGTPSIYGNNTIAMGAGNDTVVVKGKITATKLDAGDGYDILRFSDEGVEQSLSNIVNFELIDLTGSRKKLIG